MQQDTNTIECLIFDLFGVIVCFDDKLVYERISQGCSNSQNAFANLTGLVSTPDLVSGKASLRDLYQWLVSEFGLKFSFEEFQTVWQVSYSEPMPGMRDLLNQLSSQCQLILLSNVDEYYWPTVEASIPELDDFDGLFLSFENGVAKPEDEAFALAISAARASPENCFFVDDKQENIDAALRNGLKGHAFRSCFELKSELRNFGLSVI